jgi:uncharacterized protein involved in exopolysaccharide biosynthesis
VTPNISALEAVVAEIQDQLQKARFRRDNASAGLALAMSLKPAGIPAEWLPDYVRSADTVTIRAWFDPAHFGNKLERS